MRIYGQLVKARLQNIAGAVAASVKGLIYYRTDTDKIYVDDSALQQEIQQRQHLLTNFRTDGPSTTNKAHLALCNNSANNGYEYNNAVIKDTKANITAMSRSAGATYYATDELLYYGDDGTNLIALGSGGSGVINLLTNGDAELNVNGWSGYIDAAGATPVDGTGGGTPNITFTRNTTAPLGSNGDFKFSKDAANRQGQGWSYDFTVQRKYAAKVLRNMFNYRTTANFVTGDVGIHLYRVTATAKYIPVDRKDIEASDYGDYLSSWQTEASSTNDTYRLIIHQQSTSALAYDIFFDDIVVGPSQVARAPIIKKQGYSIRQAQSSMTDRSPQTEFNLGTAIIVNTGDNLITVSDDSANTRTKFTANETVWVSARSHATLAAGNTNQIRLFDSAGTVIYDYQSNTSYTSNVNVEASAFFKMRAGDFFCQNASPTNTGDTNSVEFTAFSFTDQVVSQDYGLREISFSVNSNSAQSIPHATTTAITFGNTLSDKTATWSSNTCTIQEAGTYIFDLFAEFANATNLVATTWSITKNGTAIQTSTGYTDISGKSGPLNIQVDCIKGDTIQAKVYHETVASAARNLSTGQACRFYGRKLQSSQQIAAPVIVKARYTTDTGQSIPSATITTIVFEDLVEDSHLMVNTSNGDITAKSAGTYTFKSLASLVSHLWVSGNNYYLAAYKNGSLYAYGRTFVAPAAVTDAIALSIDVDIPLLTNDVVTIRIYNGNASSRALISNAASNYLEVKRVGGIA